MKNRGFRMAAASTAAFVATTVAGPASALEFSVKNCTGNFAGVTVYGAWFDPAFHDLNQPDGYDWWAPGETVQFSCGTATCKVRIRIPGGTDVWPANPIVSGDICIQKEGDQYWPQAATHPQCNIACKSAFNP